MSEPSSDMPRELPYTSGPTAMWLGIGSLICTSVGFCLCYVPFLLAAPMALAAIMLGYRTMSDPEAHPHAAHMGRGGLVAGIVALVYLFVLGTLLAAYIGLYVVIIGLAIVAG